MPKPSEFIKQVRHHGLRSADFSRYACPVDLQFHDLELAPHRGKYLDEIIAQLRDASATTDALLRAALPAPRTTIDSKQLRGSSFVRIALWERGGYDEKRNLRLQALVHAEYALRAPVDLEPDDERRSCMVPRPQMVLTLRILDVHIQQDEPLRVEYLTDVLGWALSDQLFQHLGSLTSAVYDSQGYEHGCVVHDCDLMRFELQGDTANPSVATLLANVEANFRNVCATAEPRYEPFEWLDLEAGVDLRTIAIDAAFEDALQQGRTSRKSAAKPPRPRADPNAVHHVLLREDPGLRWRNAKVLNLWRLARMQVQASDNRITAALEARGIDWCDTDGESWGSSTDERREQMMRNPNLELITWVFVIDDGTQVFSAIPVRATELTPARLLEAVQEAWRGQHGLLRGPPMELSIPTSYLDSASRAQWALALEAHGVALTAPASGFAAPLHVPKLWCEASRRIEKADRHQTDTLPPAVTSFRYLQDWAFAHLLSEHANCTYRGDGHELWEQRYALQGGGYGSMTTIRVQDYVQALGLGPVDAIFSTWRAACHPDFQHQPMRRRGEDARHG